MFGKKKTVEKQVKDSKRELQGNMRDIERELTRLKREEEALVKEIKASAASGNQASTKILAQNLVRMRGQKDRLNQSLAQIRGISTNMTVSGSMAAMPAALAKVTKASAAVSATMDPAKMQKQMQAFAKQEAKLDMAQEMMGSAVEFGEEDLDEETDNLMNKVLDEIGLETAAAMKPAPQSKVAAAAVSVQGQPSQEEDNLSKMLAALR